MLFIQNARHRFPVLLPTPGVARVLAWLIAALAALIALRFVLRSSSPVIQQDAWYFLDVFLRKAIDGSLGFGDFFVKRKGIDHAQPLFKLVMLFEWRYFDLDFVVEAVVGLLAASASALVLYWLVACGRRSDRSDAVRYLAWAGMCALLFSLNADARAWVWPLVALENLTTLVTLLFFVAVWQAHQRQRYLLLAIATLVECISNDDSALIAVMAVVIMLALVRLRDPAQRRLQLWKTLGVIGICAVLVRIGYTQAPVIGGSDATSLSSNLALLFARLRDGGWWQWTATPLVMPVVYGNPFPSAYEDAWLVARSALVLLLVGAHLWFWGKVWRGNCNRQVFVAACLMLLFYGWVAGIILGRVALFGNDYLGQPRYVLRYAVYLIALLLMWAESSGMSPGFRGWWHAVGTWLPVAGCLVLLAVQIPLSRHARHLTKYDRGAYSVLARQIDELARDPAQNLDCPHELTVCHWPLAERHELTQLLSQNRLNIYSKRVQRWHDYLPKLVPVAAETSPLRGTTDLGRKDSR